MSPEQRAEIIGMIERYLWNLGQYDDDKLAAIALLTGYTLEDLRDLGGVE